MQQDVSLADRYDLSKKQVLLNGTQALVRMMLMQSARDRAAGHRTAGYVTGYRGSPLGAVDFQMTRAAAELENAQVRFQEGLNEDLAATALWGSQQAELRGEGKFEGVFGLCMAKGRAWIAPAMSFVMRIWPAPRPWAVLWRRLGMITPARARPHCTNRNGR